MRSSRLILQTSYFQFTLEWGRWDPTSAPCTGGNGLVWVTDGAAVVVTGMDSGYLPVTITVADTEPALNLQGWDDVVDVSVTLTGGPLVVCSPAGEYLDQIDLPTVPQTRTHRMRVCGTGRDAGRRAQFIDTDDEDQMVERYHVTFWPAPPAPETRHKLTSQTATDIRAGA